jgi:hypothetical protein
MPLSYTVLSATIPKKEDLEVMSIAVKLSFKDLVVTPGDVARYAGGSHYRPDAKRKRLAADILERASALVQPAFVYAAYHMDTVDPEQGVSLFISHEKPDAGAIFFAAAVCTIGPKLENETLKLMAQGKASDALFMDAAGVALLEALSDEVHSHLKKEAAKEGLFTGCRFGPGYGNIPVDAQKSLFESVNPEAIGVQLKASGILFPLKSLSFWVIWYSQPPPEGNTYKCQNCTLNNCAYRIAPKLR